MLSPILFTYFIDDLLTTLSNTSCGLRIVHFLFNNFAYADDVNLLAATVPDLQKLMNICFEYSKKWRFVFGFEKTKCTVFGKFNLTDPPSWTSGPNDLQRQTESSKIGFQPKLRFIFGKGRSAQFLHLVVIVSH